MARGQGWVSNYGFGRNTQPVPFRRRRPPSRLVAKVGAPLRMGGRTRTSGRTMTKRRKKKKVTKIHKRSENSSASQVRFGKYKIPTGTRTLLKSVIARRHDMEIRSTNATSTTGVQGLQVFTTLDKDHLIQMKTDCAGGTATDNEITFFLKSVKRQQFYKNQSNHVVKLTLYDCVAKSQAPAVAVDTVSECWSKGLLDANPGGNVTVADIGQTPHKSAEFRLYWRIERVTTIYLEPGQQHEHTLIQSINRIVKSTMFDHNALVASIPGLTTTTLAVFVGSIGHDSTVASRVSFMPATIDVAMKREIQYSVLPSSTSKIVYSNLLPTPALIANFDFMGETQDADVDPMAA